MVVDLHQVALEPMTVLYSNTWLLNKCRKTLLMPCFIFYSLKEEEEAYSKTLK